MAEQQLHGPLAPFRQKPQWRPTGQKEPSGFKGGVFSRIKDTLGEVGKTTHKKIKSIGKIMGGIFKGLSVVMGPIGMILELLNSLGILTPIIKIIDGILKLLGGKVLVALLPLITQLMDILFSGPMMDIISAIAGLLVAVIAPVLQVIIDVLQIMAPFMPMFAEVLMILGVAIGELMELLLGTPEFLAFLIAMIWVLYGVIWAVIGVIRVIVFVWTFLRNVVLTVIRVIMFIINGFVSLFKVFQTGGSIVEFFTKIFRDMLAIFTGGGGKKKQMGGTIPETGWYYMHEKEEVTAADRVDDIDYSAEMVERQDEGNEMLRDMLHYMRYGD